MGNSCSGPTQIHRAQDPRDPNSREGRFLRIFARRENPNFDSLSSTEQGKILNRVMFTHWKQLSAATGVW